MTAKGNISGWRNILLMAGILVLLLPFNRVRAQTIGFNGQAIGWTTLNPAKPFQAQAGLRYIPEIDLSIPVGNYSIEGEFSANLWGSGILGRDNGGIRDIVEHEILIENAIRFIIIDSYLAYPNIGNESVILPNTIRIIFLYVFIGSNSMSLT